MVNYIGFIYFSSYINNEKTFFERSFPICFSFLGFVLCFFVLEEHKKAEAEVRNAALESLTSRNEGHEVTQQAIEIESKQ